jgi:CBS domain-containing protein
MERPSAREIMTPDPVTARASDRLRRLASEMQLGRLRHIPVVDREHLLIGLVSQRDLLSHDLDQRVGAIMNTDIQTVTADTPAHEAAYLMLRDPIGCVPVTDGVGHLVGIITPSDLMRIAYAALGGQVPVEQLEREERESELV